MENLTNKTLKHIEVILTDVVSTFQVQDFT